MYVWSAGETICTVMDANKTSPFDPSLSDVSLFEIGISNENFIFKIRQMLPKCSNRYISYLIITN